MLDRVRGLLAGGEGISGAFRPEIDRVRLPELFVTSLQVGEASGDIFRLCGGDPVQDREQVLAVEAWLG